MMTKADIDLLPAEECIGRIARMSIDSGIIGHIISVHVVPGARGYTFEWVVDGDVRQGDFYGFQLELKD